MHLNGSPAAFRDRVEAGFGRWGSFVFRNAYAAIVASILLALGLAWQLPELRINGPADIFLHEKDPVRITRDAFREQFGRDEVIVVAIETPEIFDLRFLEKLRALHQELENEVPQLAEVTSLINARWTHGREDELIVEDLMEEWPRNAKELAELRQRVLANPLYRNYLISEDGRITTIMVELDTYSSLLTGTVALAGFDEPDELAGEASERQPFLTDEESWAITRALEQVLARHRSSDFKLFATGGPTLDATLMTSMQRDMLVFVLLSIGVIIALLFVLFRRISGVVIPMVVVVLSLLCTLGTMALTGVPITLPIQILPSFLLAVGVCASVHVLSQFFRNIRDGADREKALVGALRHSGLAVVITSLTTAGGLASFAGADLAPVSHFGIFGPLGVLFALLFTLVLLPALLALSPLSEQREQRRESEGKHVDRFLLRLGMLGTRRPRAVVLVTAGLLGLALLGMLRLRFAWDPMSWLPETEPVRVATELVDSAMRGSMTLEVQLETRSENGFHDPRILNRMEELRVYAETLERGSISVGKAVSLADTLKEIHQALNEGQPEYYAIPQDRLLVAQEFLLFENAGSDDLENFVDSQFSKAAFLLRIPWVDGVLLASFIDEVEQHFQQVLGESVEVTMTGGGVIAARIFSAVVRSMAISYAMAFLIVTPLMILVLASLRAGLISMIPNLMPILLTLGLMGWFDLPLDFSTMLIGAIILGVAVDDTIHFMHGYRGYLSGSGDPEQAVRRTLETTGRALLFTSIVLFAAFLIYAFATMGNLINFGLLAAFAVASAFLADVVLAPALLVLIPSAHSVTPRQPSVVPDA